MENLPENYKAFAKDFNALKSKKKPEFLENLAIKHGFKTMQCVRSGLNFRKYGFVTNPDCGLKRIKKLEKKYHLEEKEARDKMFRKIVEEINLNPKCLDHQKKIGKKYNYDDFISFKNLLINNKVRFDFNEKIYVFKHKLALKKYEDLKEKKTQTVKTTCICCGKKFNSIVDDNGNPLKKLCGYCRNLDKPRYIPKVKETHINKKGICFKCIHKDNDNICNSAKLKGKVCKEKNKIYVTECNKYEERGFV